MTNVTLLVDPRFSGGTSFAVSQEIEVLASKVSLSVKYLPTEMFKGREVHPRIDQACRKHGVDASWVEDFVSGENIVFHNPVCLKFNSELPARLHCEKLFVVCHENFLRPGGGLGFDVGHCLSQLQRASLARLKCLAPISPWNRNTVTECQANADPDAQKWSLFPENWTNICEFEFLEPNSNPRDIRGRHSRPGTEKFPSQSVMAQLYPAHSVANRILGGDRLLHLADSKREWDLLPFGSMAVDEFLSTIDFFVYYTNPYWRESFGRVIAEATAAGKVVITDPETAQAIGNGIIGAPPEDVDRIVSRLIKRPSEYRKTVKRAQKSLQSFNSEAFCARVLPHLQHRLPETENLEQSINALL